MEKPRVWLVLEFHCQPVHRDLVSVWISGAPLNPDRSLEDDDIEKLIGPIPLAEGQRLIDILQRQLEIADINVQEESSADD